MSIFDMVECAAGQGFAVSPQAPSSGPSDHLLPRGEKGSAELLANSMPPSPLVGEGARRAGEGALARPELTGYAKAMRHNPTEAERELLLLLRNRRLAAFKFRRQVPMGPYIADFLCFEAKLIIEADGSQHLDSNADDSRDAELRRRGFHLLRFWNNDILARPNQVLEAVWAALQEPTP